MIAQTHSVTLAGIEAVPVVHGGIQGDGGVVLRARRSAGYRGARLQRASQDSDQELGAGYNPQTIKHMCKRSQPHGSRVG